MSFILDALRKSEADRQRQNAPDFASVPVANARKPTSPWLWVVGALLIVNAIILAAFLLSPEKPNVVDVAAMDAPASPDDTFSEMVSEAKRRTPLELPPSRGIVVDTEARVVERQASTGTAAPASPAPMVATPIGPATEIPANNDAAETPGSVGDGPPTFNEVRANGAIQVADLHLDIHVYSGARDDRFVFVNMTKYKEGETLSEGPRIAQITQDGVVLTYQGSEFLLPRE